MMNPNPNREKKEKEEKEEEEEEEEEERKETQRGQSPMAQQGHGRSRWRGCRPPRHGRPPHEGEEEQVERASRQTSSAR